MREFKFNVLCFSMSDVTENEQHVSSANSEATENKESSLDRESKGRQKLREWLNKTIKVKLTDGRTLIGWFL